MNGGCSIADILSHTKWMHKYHMVFTAKYRRKIICYQLRKAVQKIIKDLCKWKAVEIIERNRMPPKMSMSLFMGKSAMIIFNPYAILI